MIIIIPSSLCSRFYFEVEVTRFIKEESGIRKEKKIMQYKVNNRGVDFFPPGTSAAVL